MNVLLGVTGSISAYKALDIITGLRASGHDVRVIATEASKMFVTEMALATISGNPVIYDFSPESNGTVYHIELCKWADILVIAPITANTIGKLSGCIADNFLTSVAIAFWDKPKLIAPAMNVNMYDNFRIKSKLKELSVDWVEIKPREGKLACGDSGIGKLEKPRVIVDVINNALETHKKSH